MTSQEAYDWMMVRSREAACFSSASSLLQWDQETFMPPSALGYRADQLAALAAHAHYLMTDPAWKTALSVCEQAEFAEESDQAANLRVWRRNYVRKERVPLSLVGECERASSLAQGAWAEARAQNDFALFLPHLETLVVLARKLADCWGYEATPYDAHLEGYEPGLRARELDLLFDKLEPMVLGLLPAARAQSADLPEGLLDGCYPVETQAELNRAMLAALGLPKDAARLDTTAHPFCSQLGPRDVRLTTRYSPSNFVESLLGTVHETGHALYDLGLPEEQFGMPLGSAASLAIHESQSRLWEVRVARGPAFWSYWLPRFREAFPDLRKVSDEHFLKAIARVRPSLIRTEADEVTYPLHIILRYRLERAMIEGSLAPKDLPEAWNAGFERLLGFPVPDDARGCLQDIHWSMGSFGYFPTYALGSFHAAQLYAAAQKALPGLEEQIARGDYVSLLGWLRSHIHAHGERYLPNELIRRATGAAPDVTAWVAAVKFRYGIG
jgi:carboxypeptidase Taq